MDYKAIIRSFEANQDNLEEKINDLKEIYQDEEKLWTTFEKFNADFLLNNKAINFLADSLQIIDNPDRIRQFELQDIKDIYRLLVRFYPNDLQYRIDLISFVYNVLDDENETTTLINEAIVLIDEKRNYLQNILTSIKENG